MLLSDPAAPILDYASPRSPARLKLPSQSTLRVEQAERCIIVTERLVGRASAVLAILLALAVIGVLSWIILTEPSAGFLFGLPLLAEIILIFPVIQNTWGRTVLRVDPNGVGLSIKSPFRGRRDYNWPAERIIDIEVDRVIALGTDQSFGEARLRIRDGPPVHLFGGHPQTELQTLVNDLRQMLKKSA